MGWGYNPPPSSGSSSATFSELSSHTSDYSMDADDFGKVILDRSDWYLTWIPEPSPTRDAAQAWCDDHDFTALQCLPTLIP